VDRLRDPPPADDLENKHPEAVHVGLLGQLPVHKILRRQVPAAECETNVRNKYFQILYNFTKIPFETLELIPL
jgi:hypothetical protein